LRIRRASTKVARMRERSERLTSSERGPSSRALQRRRP
jgi:hypothetical protein